jgi:hypothetical protein
MYDCAAHLNRFLTTQRHDVSEDESAPWRPVMQNDIFVTFTQQKQKRLLIYVFQIQK